MRSFHSGIRLPSGQPWWQNGTPQSMQRPAWRRSWLGVALLVDLFPVHDAHRNGTARREFALAYFRNPLGSATGHLQDSGPDDVAVGVEPLVDGVWRVAARPRSRAAAP